MSNRIYYSEEAKNHAQREKTLFILMSQGLGVGIGALIALIFAPRRGDVLRSEIGYTIGDALNSGYEASQFILGRLENDLSDPREQVKL